MTYTEIEELERKLSIAKLKEKLKQEVEELERGGIKNNNAERHVDKVGRKMGGHSGIIRRHYTLQEKSEAKNLVEQGYKYKDIFKMIGIPESTVATWASNQGWNKNIENVPDENVPDENVPDENVPFDLDNRLITKEHEKIVNAAKQSIKKPNKGNKKKIETDNLVEMLTGDGTGIVLASVPKMRNFRFPWFTQDKLLYFMQNNNYDSFENSQPATEMAVAFCWREGIEHTDAFTKSMRNKLTALEKKGIVKKSILVRPVSYTYPIVHDNEDRPHKEPTFVTCPQKATFWCLTEKGLNAKNTQ